MRRGSKSGFNLKSPPCGRSVVANQHMLVSHFGRVYDWKVSEKLGLLAHCVVACERLHLNVVQIEPIGYSFQTQQMPIIDYDPITFSLSLSLLAKCV